METSSADVFIGIDVGRSDHWAAALTRDGEKLFDKALPNDEACLRDLYKRLGSHGRVRVVVDRVRHHRHWPWPSPRTWAWRRATCRGRRCAGSRT